MLTNTHYTTVENTVHTWVWGE